ncbi:MAG: hypothetical protein FJX78_05565 [Armatimonadetes bacterium]|nr:hypothetical protein [Armatimonadota bacterium]
MSLFIERERPDGGRVAAIKAWVTAAFEIPDGSFVTVSEVACGLPDCPPLETVIAIFEEGREPRRFKLYKRVSEVVEDDALILANLSSAICDCCLPGSLDGRSFRGQSQNY